MVRQFVLIAAGVAGALLLATVAPTFAGDLDIKYKRGEGLFVTAPDSNFSLNMDLYGQTSFEVSKRDLFRRDHLLFNDPTQPIENIAETQKSFFLRRLRLWAKGTALVPWLSYKVELDFVGVDRGIRKASTAFTVQELEQGYNAAYTLNVNESDLDRDNRTLKMLDYYLDLAPSNYVKFRIGQFKIPYGRQELVSDYQLQMPSRSIASEFFAPKRDRGAMFFGATPEGRFGYALGAFNGTGIDIGRNTDPDLGYAARITATSGGPYLDADSILDGPRSFRVQGGFAWYSTKNHVGRDNLYKLPITDVKDSRQEADIAFLWRRANILLEGFARKVEVSDFDQGDLTGYGCPGAKLESRFSCDQRGLALQGGYFVGAAHEFSARFSKIDFDTDFDNDERKEITVSYTYFMQRHALRWTTAITRDQYGINALGGSGFQVQFGPFVDTNQGQATLDQNPSYFPGIREQKDTSLITMLQVSL